MSKQSKKRSGKERAQGGSSGRAANGHMESAHGSGAGRATAGGTGQDVRECVIKGIKWSMMFILPVVAFFLVEAYWHNPFAEVRPQAKWFNILIYELIAWILFFVTGRSKWALRILWTLALVYGLTNYYVMEFRSTPFVPWDLFSVGTAASVAGNYDFTPSATVVVLSLVFIAGIILEGFVDLRLYGVRENGTVPGILEKLPGPAKRFVWLWRFVPAALLFLILSSFVGQLQKEEFQLEHNLYPFLFTPSVMNKYNGFAVTFAMDLAYVVVEKPKGYSTEAEKKVMEEYDEKAAANIENGDNQQSDGKGRGRQEASSGDDRTGAKGAAVSDGDPAEAKKETTNDGGLPNVIVIMNEAFSDLGVLGEEFQTDQDCMPFVHRLQKGQENTITGQLNVSVCGGNTANTEFEFLTGNSMAFLPVGSIPYQQYVTGSLPSLASHLKGLGYDTTAIHPYNASGWNRDKVYPLLGFDRFDSLKNFSGVSYLRDYVSDASDYDKVKEVYEEGKGGKPQFIFNVTMQNHGSYTQLFDNFTPDIRSNAGTDVALHQYLSLIRQSDLAFQELVDYFSKEDEKTILVFFGDHQPADSVARPVWQVNGVNDMSLTDEQRQSRYLVPYVVWANFPIGKGSGQDTSVNYLAQRVLTAAGIPLDGYETWISELQEKVPVISAIRREGDEEKITDYQKLQYYQMFDREEE